MKQQIGTLTPAMEACADDGRYNCFYPIENRDDYDEPVDALVVSMPVISATTLAVFKRAEEYTVIGAMFDKDIVSRFALNPNVRMSLYRTNPDTSWAKIFSLGYGAEADEEPAEEPSDFRPFEVDSTSPGEEEAFPAPPPPSKRKSSSKKKGGKKA